MSKIDTTVGKLVSMIADGELRLPEMQRRYLWPATRVRDLLDSLYREYPSRTILVWETDREMPSRDLAVEQGTSPFKGHKLLLDGQQRLTSLSAILRGKPVHVRGPKHPGAPSATHVRCGEQAISRRSPLDFRVQDLPRRRDGCPDSNGRIEWKASDSRTLRELQEGAAEA